MALSLSKIEAVDFGGIQVIPKLDRTKLLRLREIEIKEENLDEAAEVLADCFGSHKAEVEEFLKKNPFITNYTRLKIYLTQGQNGLDSYEKSMDTLMTEQMGKVMDDALKELKAKEETTDE